MHMYYDVIFSIIIIFFFNVSVTCARTYEVY